MERGGGGLKRRVGRLSVFLPTTKLPYLGKFTAQLPRRLMPNLILPSVVMVIPADPAVSHCMRTVCVCVFPSCTSHCFSPFTLLELL